MKTKLFIISFLMSCVFAYGCAVAACYIIMLIDPPITDAHVSMPIGQTMLGMIIAIVSSIVFGIILYKKLRKRYK